MTSMIQDRDTNTWQVTLLRCDSGDDTMISPFLYLA